MRPTGIGYRSPREKTPAFYTTYVRRHRSKFFFNSSSFALDELKVGRAFQPTSRVAEKTR